ncbi:putative calcium-binding protein CML44 [Morus notabilis]|uniref:Putative calcium-binding protein CML44 n=1 Tax=Morus notabilis TaxID=981085 RepID=W9RRJ8_9ROSA|nr:probable calcium-binding protein CML44 [Morus notabilis]EXC04741.1 putative calcium-binding protein CML44 [Morus notabilis]
MCSLSANDLNRIFKKLDKNGDGLVSVDELNWLLERIGVDIQLISLTELESLVGKSSLSFDEFLFFYKSISNPNNGESKGGDIDQDQDHDHDHDGEDSDLVKAFKVFDINDDGFISCEELQSVLIRLGLMEDHNSSGRDNCKSMIGAFDANSDGQLDFEEFKNMMLLTIANS